MGAKIDKALMLAGGRPLFPSDRSKADAAFRGAGIERCVVVQGIMIGIHYRSLISPPTNTGDGERVIVDIHGKSAEEIATCMTTLAVDMRERLLRQELQDVYRQLSVLKNRVGSLSELIAASQRVSPSEAAAPWALFSYGERLDRDEVEEVRESVVSGGYYEGRDPWVKAVFAFFSAYPHLTEDKKVMESIFELDMIPVMYEVPVEQK